MRIEITDCKAVDVGSDDRFIDLGGGVLEHAPAGNFENRFAIRGGSAE